MCGRQGEEVCYQASIINIIAALRGIGKLRNEGICIRGNRIIEAQSNKEGTYYNQYKNIRVAVVLVDLWVSE